MEIRPPAAPVTKLDKTPRPASRSNTADVAVDRPRAEAAETHERRRNPDRRRHGAGQTAIERRVGTNRRKRSVDITV